MNRYLTPYIKLSDYYYGRYLITDMTHPAFGIWINIDGIWCFRMGSCNSLKDAMQSLDDYLIKNGYTLLNEEQWDKLSLLV